jgi:ABC-2 type transport system ATP-binding protein
MTDAPALWLRGLRKYYRDVRAVDGLDLEVALGECFGLLGPNGAGKTTTLEICEGLTRPDDGEVEVLGQRWETDGARLRPRIGVSLQETQFSEKLTVLETVALFRSFHDRGISPAAALEQVQLQEKQDARVGQLSGGQKQRLALATALVGEPELPFLDEPTTGLDPQGRIEVWQSVKELAGRGTTVLLTTQYLDEAEQLADQVAILHEGRTIVNGTLAELKQLLPPAKVEYVEKQPTLEDVFLAIVGDRTAGTDK